MADPNPFAALTPAEMKKLRQTYKGRTKRPVDPEKLRVNAKPVARPKPDFKAREMPSARSAARSVLGMLKSVPQGIADLAVSVPSAAYDYIRTSTPGDVLEDVKGGIGSFVDYARENPGEALADTVVGGAKGAGEMLREASLARDMGDEARAAQIEKFAVPMMLAAMVPGGRKVKGAERMAVREGVEAAEKPLFAALRDVRPPRENINQVISANTNAGRVVGERFRPISELTGGVSNAADDQRRVASLVDAMSGPEGYVERLIVDDAGNVIEGQHRLEALRKLGVTDVPVLEYKDFGRDISLPTLQDAAASAQSLHPDHANQIAANLAEIFADEGGNLAEVRKYAPPRGFEDAWNAALNSLEPKVNPTFRVRPAEVSITTAGPAIITRPKPIETWHGTPNVFAAERKVVTPEGMEQFVVGKPDVLPDVPAEFKVLKDYPLGRFRSEKLGSGEGAQQYGIGTYVAENPEVARIYRNELTADDAPPSIAGVPLEEFYTQLQRRADAADPNRAEALYDRLSALEDLGLHGDIRGVLDRAKEGAYLPGTTEWFRQEIMPKYSAPGALYQVDLGADPREFLDYDAPLFKQSGAIREAAANLDLSHLKEGNRGRVMVERFLANNEQDGYPLTGALFMSALPRTPEGHHSLEASEFLKKYGIPGIRYWDEGSRETRKGTSNYVVFDPERDLTIKDRFAVGGSV